MAAVSRDTYHGRQTRTHRSLVDSKLCAEPSQQVASVDHQIELHLRNQQPVIQPSAHAMFGMRPARSKTTARMRLNRDWTGRSAIQQSAQSSGLTAPAAPTACSNLHRASGVRPRGNAIGNVACTQQLQNDAMRAAAGNDHLLPSQSCLVRRSRSDGWLSSDVQCSSTASNH